MTLALATTLLVLLFFVVGSAQGAPFSAQCDGPPHAQGGAVIFVDKWHEWDNNSGRWAEAGPICLHTINVTLQRWNGAGWVYSDSLSTFYVSSGIHGWINFRVWPNYNGPYSPGLYRAVNTGCNVSGCSSNYSPNYLVR